MRNYFGGRKFNLTLTQTICSCLYFHCSYLWSESTITTLKFGIWIKSSINADFTFHIITEIPGFLSSPVYTSYLPPLQTQAVCAYLADFHPQASYKFWLVLLSLLLVETSEAEFLKGQPLFLSTFKKGEEIMFFQLRLNCDSSGLPWTLTTLYWQISCQSNEHEMVFPFSGKILQLQTCNGLAEFPWVDTTSVFKADHMGDLAHPGAHSAAKQLFLALALYGAFDLGKRASPGFFCPLWTRDSELLSTPATTVRGHLRLWVYRAPCLMVP